MRIRPWQLVVVVVALAAAHTFAQTPVVPMAPDAHPSFSVATIKPHDPNFPRRGWSTTGDRFIIENQTVASMMMYAYSIDPHQLADAPDWVSKAAFDVEGMTDTPGKPNLHQQTRRCCQKLLADRFGLKFHTRAA